jgi:hypothetical protein
MSFKEIGMRNAVKGCSAGLALALAFTVLVDQADAQYSRGRSTYRGAYSTGIQTFPGGSYRGSTTIRSVSRDPYRGRGYLTTYYTNRSPVYRYATSHPLSQTSSYSHSPYPRGAYRSGTTVIHYGRQSHYGNHYGSPIYVPRTRYTRPGITIGIQF